MAVVLYWDYGFMFLSCSCSLGILGAADAQVSEMETVCCELLSNGFVFNAYCCGVTTVVVTTHTLHVVCVLLVCGPSLHVQVTKLVFFAPWARYGWSLSLSC
jgi:hypothetical protein